MIHAIRTLQTLPRSGRRDVKGQLHPAALPLVFFSSHKTAGVYAAPYPEGDGSQQDWPRISARGVLFAASSRGDLVPLDSCHCLPLPVTIRASKGPAIRPSTGRGPTARWCPLRSPGALWVARKLGWVAPPAADRRCHVAPRHGPQRHVLFPGR